MLIIYKYSLNHSPTGMGDLFSQIAVREKFAANEAFTIFADAHRNYHKAGMEFQKKAAPVRTHIL